ncbi:hypothetical protein, partial [Bradyrhizobium ottawaense]
IKGFHPGTIGEFKDSAKAFNCTGVWVFPTSTAANPGALCEYRFDYPPYTGSIVGKLGNKTQKILWISHRFTASNPETVVQEVCRQFTTDCSSVAFAKPIDLGGGDILVIRKDYNEDPRLPAAVGQPLQFELILANQFLFNAEQDSVDPSFNKPVPKF